MTKENIVAATTLSVACVAMLAFMVTTSVNCSRAAEAERQAQAKKDAKVIEAEIAEIKRLQAEKERKEASRPANVHPTNEKVWDQIVAYGLDPSVPYPDWPLAVVEVPTNAGNGAIHDLRGKVRNCSNKTLKMLSISYDVYDASDAKLGSASDFIEKLGPGETWAFNAMGAFPGQGRVIRGPFFRLASFE